MKMAVQVQEVEREGLVGLIGERVTLWGLNYIYTGKLVGVNDTCCKLEDASIVFETGPYSAKEWQTAEKLPHPCYVMLRCVESFMILK